MACENKIQESLAEQATLKKRVELMTQDLEAANIENARLTTESKSLVSLTLACGLCGNNLHQVRHSFAEQEIVLFVLCNK